MSTKKERPKLGDRVVCLGGCARVEKGAMGTLLQSDETWAGVEWDTEPSAFGHCLDEHTTLLRQCKPRHGYFMYWDQIAKAPAPRKRKPKLGDPRAMARYLDRCIRHARKTWRGVDVDKYIREIRGDI